jgi:hypothetical protein
MLPAKSREDIDFELVNLDEVKLGEGFSITVNIHVSAATVSYIAEHRSPYGKSSLCFRLLS